VIPVLRWSTAAPSGEVSFPGSNLLSDQERIWTFPARLVNRQEWIPATAIVGTTAALWAFDPTEASYFRRTSTFNGFNNIFTGKQFHCGLFQAVQILLDKQNVDSGLTRDD